jgi:hypothetical protein
MLTLVLIAVVSAVIIAGLLWFAKKQSALSAKANKLSKARWVKNDDGTIAVGPSAQDGIVGAEVQGAGSNRLINYKTGKYLNSDTTGVIQ